MLQLHTKFYIILHELIDVFVYCNAQCDRLQDEYVGTFRDNYRGTMYVLRIYFRVLRLKMTGRLAFD